MTSRIKSYLEGKWVEGQGQGVDLVDPTTEEIIGHTSTQGLDFAKALAYARSRGVPALQGLSFAQRGERLDLLVKALHAHRDELLELSTASGGNTRSDAKFDVDGATGTMAYYAQLGKELGDRRVLTDGEVEAPVKSVRYAGQHILVSRQGVAVHINAFNFPAWGMLEKLAVAWLAGVPAVVKPATSTCALAVRMGEIMVESGHVPEGAFSIIAGSCGNLVDHLGPQDVLAFTGSCHTAWSLRVNKSIIQNSVRFNVEADSLNSAILGPDAEDSDTFELFLREVARDMTQKAGQKCTAIRRILVPSARMDEVTAALTEELARVRVGNPRSKDVRMGPLATASQLEDIRRGIAELAADCTMVRGDGGRGSLHEVGDKGYFVSPVLLAAKDARLAHKAHELEVFGPVATVLPYDGTAEEASSIVALGRGGLVSSVYSDDREFVKGMVLGIAPHHGRLTIGSGRVAEHSPGPGTVLPSMVHGGPGRAGGGEELGGRRGLHFYMPRCAVQGFRPLLEKLF
jgi:3,4-dehydroadipyl-CoA semialdehyde dehydrogenase